ncbi:hypothetical protein C8J57DRAFT_1307315, partial [Mycena rebaudengoi]
MRRTAASFHLQYTLASGLVSGARRHPVQSYSDSRTLVRSASSPISPVLRGILSRRRACVAFRTHDSPTASLFASVLGFQGSTGTAFMLSAPRSHTGPSTLQDLPASPSQSKAQCAPSDAPSLLRRHGWSLAAPPDVRGASDGAGACWVSVSSCSSSGCSPLYVLPLANAHRLLPLPFAHLPLAQDVSIGLQYIRLRHNNFVPVR